jgi:hypothetical protein
MNIFIVIGTTGEYSDRDEWMVKAFDTESSAKEFERACQKEANEIEKTYKHRWDIPKGAHSLDPKFSQDYTGTRYFISEVELVAS